MNEFAVAAPITHRHAAMREVYRPPPWSPARAGAGQLRTPPPTNPLPEEKPMPATTAQIQQHADALTALLQDGCLHIYDPGVSPDTPSALTAEMSFTTGDDPLTDSRRRQALDGFAKRAMKAIVKYLAKRGTASGEQLVAMLKQNGIFPEWGDDRAYGSVFRQVRTDPTCPIYVIRADLPRRRGHGTSGGKLYGLTRQREQH